MVLVVFVISQVLMAQEQGTKAYELPPMTLQSTYRNIPQGPVADKKIVAGKKVTSVEKENIPTVPNNNHRQTLAEIPGLITSEVNNESFASISYRGLGDPHEGFNILMLRNGVPMAADPYGYPAAYYMPPAESLTKIEFYRGGAGLLFGPQPGGALNYKLKEAPSSWQERSFMTKNLAGSYGRYSTYNELTGGGTDLGYLGVIHARGAEGFREKNSDSQILNPRLNMRWSLAENQKIHFDLDYYEGKFGEPGGLARKKATNVYSLQDGIEKTTLQNDRLEIKRTGLNLSWDKDWTSATQSSATLWRSELSRASFRQSLGGSPTFGGIAKGTTNTIQIQEFTTYGADVRLHNKYNLMDEEHNFTLAVTGTSTTSPFIQEVGSNAKAISGSPRRNIDRTTNSQAIALENAFKSGRLTLVPGVRFEKIQQKIKENLNVGSAVALRDTTKENSIRLLGLGVQYQLSDSYEAYSNLSEGYKPPAFQDTVPLNTGDSISEDISESKTWSREIGFRGSYAGIESDLSFFIVDYTNQFGRVGNRLENIGASRSEGIDLLLSSQLSPKWNIYAGGSWLKAKITNGSLEGKTPQYAPSNLMRAGVTHYYSNRSLIRLQGQMISTHFGDDANSENYEIPQYTIYDISSEHYLGSLWGANATSVHWGIQNLLDESYYSRIRSNGIEPGQPRSVFAGFSMVF